MVYLSPCSWSHEVRKSRLAGPLCTQAECEPEKSTSRYCSTKSAPYTESEEVQNQTMNDMIDLMNVNSSVIERILKHEHEVGRRLTARRLIPGVSTGETIAGSDDELCGASGANAIDGCLVIGEDEAGIHAVRYSRVSSVQYSVR